METNQNKLQKFIEKYKNLFISYKITLAATFIVTIYEAVFFYAEL